VVAPPALPDSRGGVPWTMLGALGALAVLAALLVRRARR
jgi:hypothetical protein